MVLSWSLINNILKMEVQMDNVEEKLERIEKKIDDLDDRFDEVVGLINFLQRKIRI